jgi:hypothetical protein
MPDGAAGYLVLAAIVFGVNLLPAFGPPTWAILVLFRIQSDLAAVPLVLVGALAAASGRLVLATAAGHLRGRLSPERIDNLDVVRSAVAEGRGRAAAGLGLFALSPVPSAQLFIGAGLVGVRLVPLTVAFFAGRLVSYSLYVGAASAARGSLQNVFADALTSPLGIVLQIAMLAGLVALVRVDWAKIIKRGARSGRDGSRADMSARQARP